VAADPSQEPIEELVGRVAPDRRTFVRRLVIGTAFAAPIVSSFDMNSLSMSVAGAQTNQTSS
jgi:hypothetical protein